MVVVRVREACGYAGTGVREDAWLCGEGHGTGADAGESQRMAQEFWRQGGLLGVEVWAASIVDLRLDEGQNVAGVGTVWTNELGERAMFVA